MIIKEPKISVIVPVYNVENFLSRCIYSILNQTYRNIEIILVNDGSTDKSLDICNSFAELDSRIVVVNKENGGLSSARNAGLDICCGEYIGFVDSDDYIEKNMINKLYKANIDNNTAISCCGRFDVYEYKGKKELGLCPKKDEVLNSEDVIKKILTWDGVDSSACDKLFRKELWNNVRFPFGKISEDVAIMYMVIENAKRISMVSEPFYNYCHRSSSITTSSFSEKSYSILDNVKQIDAFIRKSYPNLLDELKYFKIVEYTAFLSLLAKSKERKKNVEKTLFEEIKKCYGALKRFPIRYRIRVVLYSHKLPYYLIFLYYNVKLKLQI